MAVIVCKVAQDGTLSASPISEFEPGDTIQFESASTVCVDGSVPVAIEVQSSFTLQELSGLASSGTVVVSFRGPKQHVHLHACIPPQSPSN
jgi:hypothetical protein